MKEVKFKIWDKVKKWCLNYKGLDAILWFGKYRDKSIKKIIDSDAQYIEWCLDRKIFKLNWFVKSYYLRKLNYQRELRHKLLIGMYKLEQKHGIWMDDGQGNCGFVKKDEY